jgi:hypothetical protein
MEPGSLAVENTRVAAAQVCDGGKRPGGSRAADTCELGCEDVARAGRHQIKKMAPGLSQLCVARMHVEAFESIAFNQFAQPGPCRSDRDSANGDIDCSIIGALVIGRVAPGHSSRECGSTTSSA